MLLSAHITFMLTDRQPGYFIVVGAVYLASVAYRALGLGRRRRRFSTRYLSIEALLGVALILLGVGTEIGRTHEAAGQAVSAVGCGVVVLGLIVRFVRPLRLLRPAYAPEGMDLVSMSRTGRSA